MKKIISLILVLVMTFSLGFTVLADQGNGNTEQETGPGSITITNATVDKEYAAYKVFNASHQGGSVSYTLKTTDQFYPHMFDVNGNPWQPTDTNPIVDTETGKLANGKYVNNFFTYNKDSGDIKKVETANDSEVIKYLMAIIRSDSSLKPIQDPVTATDKTVLFQNVPSGYYAITSTLGTAITVNSATPDVVVVDKNQKPGGEFEKMVQTGVDADGNPIWGTTNSAEIGEEVTYKIEIEATNYNGEALVKHYQIHDTKGDAIWAEFNSFRVYIVDEAGNRTYLPKGYYLYQGELGPNGEETLNTDNWRFLGKQENENGELVDGWLDSEKADSNAINKADWYLVHLTRDSFRITIPWLKDHTLTAENHVYTLSYPENAESKYSSPVKLVVEYDAVIEYNAVLGGGNDTNLHNKANGSWTDSFDIHTTTTKDVETIVYGLGLYKDDSSTHTSLAGAEFRLYRDKECTQPINVIPTDIEGVYILDSLGRPIETVTGANKETSRKAYVNYLGEKYANNQQDNVVVTPANGKVVIKGLAAGTYYLKETKAPDGYNAYSGVIEMTMGANTTPFYIYLDANGNVADVTYDDGTYQKKEYNVDNTTVHNSQGMELPETGGLGAMRLITFGTIIAIAFAVLLITHKKMSIYVD